MRTTAHFKPIALAFALSAMLATHAFAQPTSLESIHSSSGNGNVSIAVLGERFESLVSLSPSQGRIVLFRPAGADNMSGSTSVFVNERFHTSMVVGGYTYLCVLPGQVQIGARQIKVGQRAKDPLDSVTPLQLRGGQTVYLRVSDLSGRPVLAQVAEPEALAQLANLREQVHAVSRVDEAQRCQQQTLAIQQAGAPTERLTLAADALFQFGRSDIDALTPIGRQAIQQLIQRVGRDYDRIDRVHVIGHADPIGRLESNLLLSQQRAASISHYLQNQGLVNAQTPITSEGRGSAQPVVTGCGLSAVPESVRCHQPNRRVEVEVTGLRRPSI